jgi:hypothetical protein
MWMKKMLLIRYCFIVYIGIFVFEHFYIAFCLFRVLVSSPLFVLSWKSQMKKNT